MARFRLLAAALLLALALGSGAPAAAQDADTPLDKAIQQVEALLTALRADGTADRGLIAKLEEISGNLRKAREGASASAGASSGGGPAAPAGGGAGLPGGELPGGEWAFNRTRERFLRNVDLKEEAETLAVGILREFVLDYNLAKTREDAKSKAVIRDHTEKRIGRSFAKRDANRLKDNLNGIIRFWESGWGGGGRGGR